MRRRLTLCMPMIPMSMLEERPMMIPDSLTSVKSQMLFLNEMAALNNPVFTKTADEINFVMNTRPTLRGVLDDILVPVDEPPQVPVFDEPPQVPVEDEPIDLSVEEEAQVEAILADLVEETIRPGDIEISTFSDDDKEYFKNYLSTSRIISIDAMRKLYVEWYKTYDKQYIKDMDVPTMTKIKNVISKAEAEREGLNKQEVEKALLIEYFEMLGVTPEMIWESLINNRMVRLPKRIAERISNYYVK